VKDLIGGVPGFASYAAFRGGEGGMTVTVCQDKAGTDESSRRAAEWSRKTSAPTSVRPRSPRGTRSSLASSANFAPWRDHGLVGLRSPGVSARLLRIRLTACSADAAAGYLERFDIERVLRASGSALHLDEVLERGDAYGGSVEFYDVGPATKGCIAG
jgi:hypothetical protein